MSNVHCSLVTLSQWCSFKLDTINYTRVHDAHRSYQLSTCCLLWFIDPDKVQTSYTHLTLRRVLDFNTLLTLPLNSQRLCLGGSVHSHLRASSSDRRSVERRLPAVDQRAARAGKDSTGSLSTVDRAIA